MPARFTKSTYLEQLNEIPPYLVFALGRVGRRAITQAQLANTLGWSIHKVAKIASLKSWETVTVGDADRFRVACNCSRRDERRQRFFVRRSLDLTQTTNGFNHLRKRGGKLPKFLREIKVVDRVVQ